MWAVFGFVGAWHDKVAWHLIHWAWIFALFLAPEMAVRAVGARYYRTPEARSKLAYKLARAACGGDMIHVLVAGIIVGFVVGADWVSQLWRLYADDVGSALQFFAMTMAMMSVAAHLGFEQRAREDAARESSAREGAGKGAAGGDAGSGGGERDAVGAGGRRRAAGGRGGAEDAAPAGTPTALRAGDEDGSGRRVIAESKKLLEGSCWTQSRLSAKRAPAGARSRSHHPPRIAPSTDSILEHTPCASSARVALRDVRHTPTHRWRGFDDRDSRRRSAHGPRGSSARTSRGGLARDRRGRREAPIARA